MAHKHYDFLLFCPKCKHVDAETTTKDTCIYCDHDLSEQVYRTQTIDVVFYIVVAIVCGIWLSVFCVIALAIYGATKGYLG
jgi:uncharacterized protein (DUF983 family)